MGTAKSVFGVALAFTLASAVGACGGRTTEDEAPEPERPTASSGQTPSQAGSTDAGSGATALGPCMPGFNPADEPGHACNWLADGLCYDTKVAACSCVCPRNKTNSSCVSDFFQENGRTKVTCF